STFPYSSHTSIHTLSLHDALPISQTEYVLSQRLHSSLLQNTEPKTSVFPEEPLVSQMLQLKNSNSLKYRTVRGEGYCQDSERMEDRKSTRLNSSHVSISYAVVCLK